MNAITPESALAAYLRESRRRRTCGTTSIDPEAGHAGPQPSLDSEWYTALVGLVRGVPSQALRALELRYFGYQVEAEHTKRGLVPKGKIRGVSVLQENEDLPPGYATREQWEADADPEKPRLVRHDEYLCLQLSRKQVAAIMSHEGPPVSPSEVEHMEAEALSTIAENLGNHRREEDPNAQRVDGWDGIAWALERAGLSRSSTWCRKHGYPRHGMPVHKMPGGQVYAFEDELRAWAKSKRYVASR